MVQVPYVDSNGRITVEVELQHTADVFLVDQTNFRRYQAGQQFKYFGGHYTKSPVRISATGIGRFYLIVRNGGKYRYKFFN